jgi:porin
VANTAIPLPLQGLGGFLMYKPTPQLFFRLGVHDANADPHAPASDTLVGELFTIFEAGWDTDLVPRQKGKPPAGHVHLSAWHQDERKGFGISTGSGFTVTADQTIGRFHPYLRYGYANSDSDGPTFARQMVAAGVGIGNIFGQNKDLIVIGVSWTEPTDDTKNDQTAIDAFYRVQVTPQIEFGPTLGVVFNPVDNPDEDTVYVGGLRLRVFL